MWIQSAKILLPHPILSHLSFIVFESTITFTFLLFRTSKSLVIIHVDSLNITNIFGNQSAFNQLDIHIDTIRLHLSILTLILIIYQLCDKKEGDNKKLGCTVFLANSVCGMIPKTHSIL